MFKKIFKSKSYCEECKYKTMYELAVKNSNEFERTHDYTEFTKRGINKIESDIARLSKLGVRKLTYYNEKFNIHTNMEYVKEHIENQGFKIANWWCFDFQYGISKPEIYLDATIRW